MMQHIDFPDEIVVSIDSFTSRVHNRLTNVHAAYMQARLKEERDAVNWGSAAPVNLGPRMPPLVPLLTRRGVVVYLVTAGLDHASVDECILSLVKRAEHLGRPGTYRHDVETVRALLSRH